DIAVIHLAADGGSLIGSTYVGGTANDGLNNTLPTAYNYGDAFRGEIALDLLERPVIATSTNSVDAPTVAAPFGSYQGGDQDAYALRLDPGLTTLQWATFFGGSGTDSGYGVQFDGAGEIFITGGTTSSDIPLAGVPFDATSNGDVDGWVARFTGNGNSLISSTYLGTGAYDQSYFVQLDPQDDVYVVGQTHGNYPITPGKYAVPGSSQFIQKLSHDLSSSLWSTVVGSGTGTEDLSPSAFLVSDCRQIYFSCWGGVVNNNAVPNSSSTVGLATTPGAFQDDTNGSDFYLMVLEPDADALDYATFFGGLQSSEHVDGGTSRFDKDGNVYQAVCAGCGSNDDLPTTPGAWSQTNGSSNCNLGVFKFNLTQAVATVQIDGPNFVCHPDTVQFLNLSSGGNDYFWDFGDMTTSTEMEPDHIYAQPGIYTVTMILSDTLGCTPGDTAWVTIEVVDPLDAAVDSVPPLCPGAMVQLQAGGGYAFAWSPGAFLSDSTVADPFASPPGPMVYEVAVTDQCGTDTVQVPIVFAEPIVFAGPDTIMCVGDSVQISAFGGGTYMWSPAAWVDDPSSPTPLAFPPDTAWMHVQITSPEGCPGEDSLLVTVQFNAPSPMSEDTAVCLGDAVQLQVSGGDTYAWQSAIGITDLNIPDPFVSPPASMYYWVTLTNTCGSILDSVFVEVREAEAQAWPDTVLCVGGVAHLHASGGVSYVWSPPSGLNDPLIADPLAAVQSPIAYTVSVTDMFGCVDEASVSIDVHPVPTVDAGPDVYLGYVGSGQFQASGNGTFSWDPTAFLSDPLIADPIVQPPTTATYTVTLTDTNGCTATDVASVIVVGSLYAPNTFTPNGDGINDRFLVLGTEIADFSLLIFNRWGEKIFESDDLREGWDGTYNGVLSPIDTYVWRVDYQEYSGDGGTLFGHVNLVR
ncbi:MAG: gliding motility-associated C-terminal domain-containing protein, partial [Flavobacteriales bacterium]|nr:gliding motility-associated C-terminal domain-containing protein [Flavobacteriales bacterium]